MSGPEWALGYDVADLKALARPFKDRYATMVYGAFGLPKERDMALALQAGALVRLPDGGVAIARQLKAGATHRDFTGRAIKVPAGDWMVSDFCPGVDPHASVLLLEATLRERSDAPIWVEVFREDEQLVQGLAGANFLSLATKIAAGSEIKGLYLRCALYEQGKKREERTPPPLPEEEYLTLNTVEWAFLDAAELAQVDDELMLWERSHKEGPWAQHYSSYNKRGSWTAFCLRGYAADPTFVMKPAEMSKTWKAEHPDLLKAPVMWTEAAEAFPITRELLDRIPGQKERVRFMRLASGNGELTRHADITDRDAGVADGKIARLHLPIRSHPAVQFTAWAATGYRIDVNMKPGDLWYLDQRKPHMVKNDSPVDRVHLVVDVLSSPELRRMLSRI